jgi:uncharacterized membrane protein
MTETHLRTWTRAIVYRILAILITAYFIGFSTAVIIHIILTVLYYIHERAWMKVSWGLKK